MEPTTDKLTLGSLVNSITSPTPIQQKKIRALAIKIFALAALVLVIDKATPHFLPVLMVTLSKLIATVSGTSAAHTYTTKETPAATSNTATDGTQAAN